MSCQSYAAESKRHSSLVTTRKALGAAEMMDLDIKPSLASQPTPSPLSYAIDSDSEDTEGEDEEMEEVEELRTETTEIVAGDCFETMDSFRDACFDSGRHQYRYFSAGAERKAAGATHARRMVQCVGLGRSGRQSERCKWRVSAVARLAVDEEFDHDLCVPLLCFRQTIEIQCFD